MSFENVKKISYKNETFSIGEDNVNDVLALLGIDTSTVNLEVTGDTLFVVAKAGTKGAESLADILDALGVDVTPAALEEVEEIEVEEVSEPQRVPVTIVDGKIVELEPETEEDEEDPILAKLREYQNSKETVKEEVEVSELQELSLKLKQLAKGLSEVIEVVDKIAN